MDYGLALARTEFAVGESSVAVASLVNLRLDPLVVPLRCDNLFNLQVRRADSTTQFDWGEWVFGTTAPRCFAPDRIAVAPGESLRVQLPFSVPELGHGTVALTPFYRPETLVEFPIDVVP